MKIQKLHLWFYGDEKLPIFRQSPKTNDAGDIISEEIPVYFLNSEITGDFNRKTFSKKQIKPGKKNSKTEFVDWILFRPYKGIPGDGSKETKEIEREISRGLQFFTEKDGILFGARCELAKIGQFIKISNPY